MWIVMQSRGRVGDGSARDRKRFLTVLDLWIRLAFLNLLPMPHGIAHVRVGHMPIVSTYAGCDVLVAGRVGSRMQGSHLGQCLGAHVGHRRHLQPGGDQRLLKHGKICGERTVRDWKPDAMLTMRYCRAYLQCYLVNNLGLTSVFPNLFPKASVEGGWA